MHWILQLGLEAGHAEDVMLEALQDLQVPHTVVKVVPFTHELIPEPQVEPGAAVVVYGGVVMKGIAEQRSWTPGCYLNDNFTFEQWRDHWGDEMLNHDSLVCRFDEVPLQHDHFFIRPNSTDKSFTGCCLGQQDYREWRTAIQQGTHTQHDQTLQRNTLVAVAPWRKILQEVRFFVAGGKILTGSFYRSLSWHKYIPFFGTPWYSPELHQYVQARVDHWQPDRAFVIDIAVMATGYKIIEINCYNTSGLYECDARRIILGIEELETPK